MKISKWSILGIVLGFAWCLVFGIRYLLIWPDDSQAIIYLAVGALIMGVAWLYGENLDTHNKLTALEEYLADKKIQRRSK